MSARKWPAVLVSSVAWLTWANAAIGAETGPGADGPESESTLIWFQEQESGTGSYLVRMIANDRYLRIDDGEESDGFVLFNRDQKIIYSVDHDNRSVLILSDKTVDIEEPKTFDLTEEEVNSQGSPSIGGSQVKIHRLYTNKQLCFEVASAAGLLADVVEVLREFHRALATEQAVIVARMPKDLATDCDVSEMVLAPDRYLRFGFPVRQRDYNGRTRQLREFETNYRADPRLFELPMRYQRVTTEGLRG